ncbi:BMP family protein [Zhaonella formicivorans]|uniref:BMP family protein n=1 Tax=Zhaonella formicivorans TaxID=2528593 RepID=UPI0010D2DD32|nr:BMP family protein [Zhaonella formicivorans]
MHKIKKILVLAMLAVFVFSLAACGGGQSQQPSSSEGSQSSSGETSGEKTLRVAMLVSGPVNDGGWNQSAYEGLKLIERELGAEIAFTEKVQQADQANIMRDYARKGYDLIIGHGFEYSDTLLQIAEEFPDTKFVGVGTKVTAPNLAALQFNVGELGHLVGIVVSQVTKSNKIGIVAGMDTPTGKAEFDNIIEVTKKINPKAEVVTAYTNSWEDVPKAKEAALAQIASGVDVIVANGDACNLGVIQAAKEKGIQVVGWTGDQHDLAPDNVLTSAVQRVDKMMLIAAQELKNGTFEGKIYNLGLKDGVQYMGTYNDKVPEELRQQVEKEAQGIIDGTVQIKTGF